jgi:5S rRNA maturation endonuclease (ribonuclease M5)
MLGNDVIDSFERVVNHFHLSFRQTNRMWVGPCPIHGGDRQDALNIYHTGHSHKGNWYCNTRKCERTFVSSPIGFIRGLLSRHKHGWEYPGDQTASFMEAVEWCSQLVNKSYDDLYVNEELIEQNRFTATTRAHSEHEYDGPRIPRNRVRAALEIPPEYYIRRGYPSSLLDEYDVGLCTTRGKPMTERVVFPVYDENHEFMIGCTGRSMWEKCGICGAWHNPKAMCPPEDKRWIYSKWKHSDDFDSEYWLYNYGKAKDYILDSGVAIIVESPGNVLRLEQAGYHNSVATFGAKLSDGQKKFLDKSGALTLIVLTDPDEAGIIASETISSVCQDQYKLLFPKLLQDKDVADHTVDELHDILRNYL